MEMAESTDTLDELKYFHGERLFVVSRWIGSLSMETFFRLIFEAPDFKYQDSESKKNIVKIYWMVQPVRYVLRVQ